MKAYEIDFSKCNDFKTFCKLYSMTVPRMAFEIPVRVLDQFTPGVRACLVEREVKKESPLYLPK